MRKSTNRKTITKKTRFEVFKRDSFTCQYCGRCAPDVVLHVDHIVPVAAGGDNNILNLITACFDCNSGKSSRELSDTAVVRKQMDQMKLLNERQEQVKMIAQWRAGLAEIEQTKLQTVRDAINAHLISSGKEVTDEFLKLKIKPCINKFGLSDTLDAVEKSADQYYRNPDNPEHASKFINMIPKICYWVDHDKKNPIVALIRKIAYVANKRWTRCDPKALTARLLTLNQKHGFSTDTLYALVCGSTGIMSFEDSVRTLSGEAANV